MCEGKCVICDPIDEWDEDHYWMARKLRELMPIECRVITPSEDKPDEEKIGLNSISGELARRARRLVNAGVYSSIPDMVSRGIELALDEGEKETKRGDKA